GVLLLVAAWPGWLHAWFNDPWQARRVAWTVEGSPGLHDTAELLQRLHREGVFGPEPRGFYQEPQLVNYCAWHCPEEKAFFDQRFTLYPEVTQTFLDLRGTLTLEAFAPKKTPGLEGDDSPEAAQRWQDDAEKTQKIRLGRLATTLREKGITHVVLSGSDPRI